VRVHVVHGILDRVGTAGLLNLVPYLQAAGFDCRVPDYGLITAAETRIVNPIIRRTLLPYIEPGDLYVGHSNGCAIGYELVQLGAPLAGLCLINGALKRDITLPAGVWADCYYNAGDDATVAAVASAKLGISDPVWGDMGHSGPLSDNPLIVGIDAGKSNPGLVVLAGVQDFPAISGHGDIFTPPHLAAGWGKYIAGRLLVHAAAQAAAHSHLP
jgi:hypothetical protein